MAFEKKIYILLGSLMKYVELPLDPPAPYPRRPIAGPLQTTFMVIVGNEREGLGE